MSRAVIPLFLLNMARKTTTCPAHHDKNSQLIFLNRKNSPLLSLCIISRTVHQCPCTSCQEQSTLLLYSMSRAVIPLFLLNMARKTTTCPAHHDKNSQLIFLNRKKSPLLSLCIISRTVHQCPCTSCQEQSTLLL